jgi:hypothetical protein
MWKVLLWHCHNKATVYFNPFIMIKNKPIAGSNIMYCEGQYSPIFMQ